MPLLPAWPNWLLALLMKKIVKIVVMAQKKHRHVSLVDQKLAPSSSENSTPPIGAPKAAAMPAAVPHAAKSGGGGGGGDDGDGGGGVSGSHSDDRGDSGYGGGHTSLLLIVPEVLCLRETCLNAQHRGLDLAHFCSQCGTCVHHGALLAQGEACGARKHNADHLAAAVAAGE